MENKSVLEQPTVPDSGDLRYMTQLWVTGYVDPQEEVKYKIRAALKFLSFREQHVLVQFWSPFDVGECLLLTTIDHPFGVGAANEQLCLYRKDSECNNFLVDKDRDEEGISPPARVFSKRLPEWTRDVANYMSTQFPQQECAIRCNLHGYLALPVFDTTTGLCVGVLELLTSSKLEDFAYEVKHIHQELKIWNLTTPQVFDGPVSNMSFVQLVLHESRKTELDNIFGILKDVCDTHRLPLAQTWTVSPSATCFALEKSLQKGCSSFNTRCFGKICMSTAQPFYVRDLNVWPFMEASKKCHLEKSTGVAGRALSSRGSCFCGDVTRLDEEEYPLVHNARMNGLTGCFAIFLYSVESNVDYVLEFFLPLDIKDSQDVLKLVQTLKQSIPAFSGFELVDDMSSIEVVEPPMDLSVNETDSSNDLESIVTDTSEHDYANVADQLALTNDSTEEVSDNFTIEKGNHLKQVRKRKRDSDTILSTMLVMVNATFNKSVEQFTFPLFHGLSNLKTEVAKRFDIDGQRLRLKYRDEDGDLILICPEDDLKSALDASSCMNLLCCLED